MDIELQQIAWEDYIKIPPAARKLVGYPAYYSINPDTNRCVIYPTPLEGVKIVVKPSGN